MSLLRTLRNRLAGAIAVREAVGSLTDPDEAYYRQISGSGDNPSELSDFARQKERAKGRHQYFRHPVGGALPDMLTARVLGAGVEYKAPDEQVKAVIDRFLADPDNDLDAFLPLYTTELQVFGELVLPVFLTEANADVRLGYLPPHQVSEVLWAPGDAKKPIAVVQKGMNGGDRRLWVIPQPAPEFEGHYPPHPALASEAPAEHVMPGEDGLPVALPLNARSQVAEPVAELLKSGVTVAGYAFYHRANCLVSGRGRSLYERINDWLKATDDFFFGTVRQAILQQMFVWKCTLTGGNKADIEVRKEEIRKEGLKPGKVLVTNERETWEALGPSIPNATGIREILGGLLRLIGTATGFPGHELGAEGDTNRSTAKESRSVSVNRAKLFQRQVAAMVKAWLSYQVDQKVYRGQLSESVDRTVEVVLPELDARDEGEVAQSVLTGVQAMVPALENGLVLEQDARAYLYQLLGMPLPDATAFQQEEQERQARQQDAFLEPQMKSLRAMLERSGVKEPAGMPPADKPVPGE